MNNFSAKDKIEYTGSNEIKFHVACGRTTLNGELLEIGKTYTMKNGDILKDLDRNAPNHDESKWKYVLD